MKSYVSIRKYLIFVILTWGEIKMGHKILYYSSGEFKKSPYYDELWELVCSSEDEFIPPLNQRSSTTQKDLTGLDSTESLPTEYFKGLMEQETLILVKNNKLLGFMSFRSNYVVDGINLLEPTVYVSTIIVNKEFRRRGVCNSLYKELLDIKHHSHNYICTRTWSTNISHLAVLEKNKFKLVKTKKNDRGNGIDTVYFIKSII